MASPTQPQAANWSPPAEWATPAQAQADTNWSPPKEWGEGQPQQAAAVPGFIQGNMDVLKAAPRQLLEGTGKLADAATGMMETAFSEGRNTSTEPGQQPEPEHPVFTAIAREVADRLGLPKTAQGKAQRIIGAGVEAIPSGLATGPAGMVPAAISGAASQGAAEVGAGPAGQFAAGILAPTGPALAQQGVKGLLRGSEANAANMRENLATFEKAGVTPTSEQVGAAKAGGAPTKATLAQQPQQAQQQVEKIAQQSAGGVKSATNVEAGESIDNGVKANRIAMAQQESQAYDKARTLIGGNVPMEAPNFIKTGQKVIHPTGDPEIDEWLVGNKTKGLVEAGEAATKPGPPGSVLAPTGPRGGLEPYRAPPRGFDYDTLRAMRSKLGSMIDWGLNPSNPGQNAEWKQLYGALGKDLEQGIAKAPPGAQAAYKAANDLYKGNQRQRDLLDTVVQKVGGPEAVYKAATSNMVDGPTKLRTVMGAMSPEEQGTMRSAITERLGKPRGAENRQWDENTYRTNWGNLSDETRTVLYGPKGSATRDQLEAIGNVLDIRKNLGQVSSGLAEGVKKGITLTPGHGATLLGAGALVAGAVEHFGKMAVQIAEGHPFAAAGGAALTAGVAGSRMAINRVLNNKAALNWLASASKAPKSALPSLLTQLSGQTGEDIKGAINGE